MPTPQPEIYFGGASAEAEEVAERLRFDEAAQRLTEMIDDARLGSGRSDLARIRREMVARSTLMKAEAAWKAGDRDRARVLAEEVVAAEVAAEAKTAARRLLLRIEARVPAGKSN